MKLDWKSGIGFVISGFLLWYTLRGTDLSAVWKVLRTANVPLFLLSVVVSTCIFPLRARRWRTILEPVAGVIPFGPLWRSTAIGMMMNNVFPFRAGEFARAFALTREVPRVSVTTSLSSLAVDRIFDALVLFAMMFGAMLDPRFPANVTLLGRTVPQMAAAGIAAMTVLLVVCFVAVLQTARVLALVRVVVRPLLPRWEDRVAQFAEQAIGGLAVLKDARRFLAVLWWAAAHWAVNALALYVGFLAVGIDAPFTAALFLQGVVAIGVAIPSSPGFFGVFELAATLALGVYGVPQSIAVSWALGYHLLTFVPITVMGAVYFARLGLNVATLASAKARTDDAPTEPPYDSRQESR